MIRRVLGTCGVRSWRNGPTTFLPTTTTAPASEAAASERSRGRPRP